MKTPWRYLADLASRRRAVREKGSTGSVDGANGSKRPLVLALTDETTGNGEHEDEPAPELSRVDEAPGQDASSDVSPDHLDRSLPEDVVDVARPEALTQSSETEAPVRRPARKKSHEKMVSDVPPERLAQPISSGTEEVGHGQKTFHDELTALDGEIKQLRLQLAEKLQQQNNQLRKMLKRFGTS